MILIVFLRTRPTTEGFQVAFEIPLDAENPTLDADQVYGLIPATASASIYQKKDSRDKVKNLDTLPYDKAEGKYYIEASTVELNLDPNDIEVILNAKASKEGFATTQDVIAQASQDQLGGVVQEKVQDKLLKTKSGEKLGNRIVKNLVKVNTKLSAKLGSRIGAGMAKKLTEKASLKIAELIGKRAAIATSLGAAQTAIPGAQVFGIILTAFGIAGIAAQVAISTILKGEDGFCPTGYERLNGAIPEFLTKIPGIGDILDVMGAYVCYRNACEPNEDEDTGLCYNKCDTGYKGIGPVCWANSTNVGTGQLKQCPSGWTNDGLTCREPITCDPVRWDDCCSKTWPGICWGCLRGGTCHGGTVKGRAAGSDLPCPKTHPTQIDGLCYKQCPSNTPNRVKGMPYLCSAASSVGDGRGKTSYGRGVGRPKLKMKPVEKNPIAIAIPPANSSAAFAQDPTTTCKADFASTNLLNQMCRFYYRAASKNPQTVSGGIQIQYISRITRVIASGEQSCDIQCDITTVTLANATSKTPIQSVTVKDKTRRFYFAKIAKTCQFIVTGATNIDGTGKEISNPDVVAATVNYSYNPFI